MTKQSRLENHGIETQLYSYETRYPCCSVRPMCLTGSSLVTKKPDGIASRAFAGDYTRGFAQK